MSNTSTVTPYSQASIGPRAGAANAAEKLVAAAGAVAAVGACAAGVARWLARETEEDRAVRQRLNAARQREALTRDRHEPLLASAVASASIQTVPLRLRDPQPLLRAAEKLGFTRERPALVSDGRREAALLLRKPTGERLAIGHTAEGTLVVHTAGDRRRISNLVRQHTVDQTVAHFTRRGMRVTTAARRRGEVQVLARAEGAPGSSTAAEVRTEVYADGSLCVDVNDVRGERCREIVDGLAGAVGGEVTATHCKDAWFDRPGEATRSRERA